MFKPIASIILSAIPAQPIQEVFYFDEDYSTVAREYYPIKIEDTFDPNDFMYKLIIKELEENETLNQ
jgi:hypothetical protein